MDKDVFLSLGPVYFQDQSEEGQYKKRTILLVVTHAKSSRIGAVMKELRKGYVAAMPMTILNLNSLVFSRDRLNLLRVIKVETSWRNII